ncbi:hypothetical protein TSOC_007373 [Tetrabaena socialis]|uniref:Uncharacterized protein n=1 Tax=Tetrabaena socialis TaxID=47790 RepID=A0A2J8A176_9CHLO|nr:hypothetical protein TSOC_007373 [Tetrabaena socialis]|eukprot:PNH06270.1 hypothetical protein TSOC_007373 [Tetrabaena socialis]
MLLVMKLDFGPSSAVQRASGDGRGGAGWQGVAGAVSRPLDIPSRPPVTSSIRTHVDVPAFKPEWSDVGEEPASGLQFALSPEVTTRQAYKNAVCVPMLDQPRLAPMVHGSLEQQVQQLVSGYGGSPADTPGLAAYLQRNSHGLRVEIMAPAQGQKSSPLTTRAITAPFIVVTAAGPLLQQQQPQVVVVDAVLREHLAVAPSTPAYDRSLAALVPALFVGSLARLHETVALLAPAAELSFRVHGMEVPPWRRRAALLHRWSRLARAPLLLPAAPPPAGPQLGGQSALSAALHSKDSSPRAEPEAATAGAVAAVATYDSPPVKRQDSWGYGLEILDVDMGASDQDAAPARAQAKKRVETVVGFAVGSAAAGVGRVPWGDKAAFAAALPRRSVFGADSDGADSEEMMLGVSPLSVFRV